MSLYSRITGLDDDVQWSELFLLRACHYYIIQWSKKKVTARKGQANKESFGLDVALYTLPNLSPLKLEFQVEYQT